MNNDTIGVDVSKDHLDAHRLKADGFTWRFANTKEVTKRSSNGSRRRFIPGRVRTDRPIIAPSNARWASLAFRSSRSIRVRRAASPRATGKSAKTDRLDAAILARMGCALLELQACPARSELFVRTEGALRHREALVKDRTAAKNRGKVLTPAAETSECSAPRTDRSPDRDSRSGHSPDYRRNGLADRFAILISIPGVSNITAFALLIAMPELGSSKRPGRQPRRPGRRSPDSQGVESVAHSSAAGAPTSAKRSTCRPSSPLASIQT